MTKLRFEGRVLPKHITITVKDHPTLNWEDTKKDVTATFNVEIDNSAITINFESNRSDPEHIQEATLIAIDMSQVAVSLVAVREAEGIYAVLDNVHYEDGSTKQLVASDARLKGLLTAVDTNEDTATVLELLMTEPVLMLAIRDLADSIRTVHSGAINCGRVIDAICTYFIPVGRNNRAAGWGPMRSALNIKESCLKEISEISKGPRHGNRKIEATADLGRVGANTWKIMNRFLEYRKRNNQPLPSAEFPELS